MKFKKTIGCLLLFLVVCGTILVYENLATILQYFVVGQIHDFDVVKGMLIIFLLNIFKEIAFLLIKAKNIEVISTKKVERFSLGFSMLSLEESIYFFDERK